MKILAPDWIQSLRQTEGRVGDPSFGHAKRESWAELAGSPRQMVQGSEIYKDALLSLQFSPLSQQEQAIATATATAFNTTKDNQTSLFLQRTNLTALKMHFSTITVIVSMALLASAGPLAPRNSGPSPPKTPPGTVYNNQCANYGQAQCCNSYDTTVISQIGAAGILDILSGGLALLNGVGLFKNCSPLSQFPFTPLPFHLLSIWPAGLPQKHSHIYTDIETNSCRRSHLRHMQLERGLLPD